jgi:hypothetical protein
VEERLGEHSTLAVSGCGASKPDRSREVWGPKPAITAVLPPITSACHSPPSCQRACPHTTSRTVSGDTAPDPIYVCIYMCMYMYWGHSPRQ